MILRGPEAGDGRVTPVRYDPERLAMNVGRRIAEVRRERGMTQVQIATKLRVAYQWISQIECGQNVSVHTLARLANALDVAVEAFFEAPKPTRARPRRGRPPTSAT